MSFLDPFLLVGLTAIVIPLIIHFINLRKPEKLPFSSVTFLEELQKSTVKRIKIKEYLLLAIRILAISLLTIALARPFLLPKNIPGFASSTKPKVFYILVDNSPSMAQIDENGPYLDQAKSILKNIVNQANDKDRFIIFNTNGELINANMNNKNTIDELLKKIKVQNKGDFTEERLKRFYQINKKMQGQRAILYWLSDGQKTQLEADLKHFKESDSDKKHNVPLSVYFIQIGSQSNNNTAITKIDVPDKIISIGKKMTILVKVSNFGDKPVYNQFLSLNIGGKMMGQYEIQLKPHQSKRYSFEVSAPSDKYLSGKAILEGDPYDFDNIRYFSVKIPAVKKILIVTPSHDFGINSKKQSFLVSALQAAEETSSQIRLKLVTIDKMNQVNWKSYDAIILEGLTTIPDYLTNDLRNFIQNGHGLILYPSEKADISSYNHFLSEVNAGKFTGFRGEYGAFKPIANFQKITEGHPIFRNIFEKKKNEDLRINLPHLYYYWVYETGQRSGEDVILRSNLSDPILSEQKFGNGIILISSIGTDPGWSDFPVSSLYAPINYRMALFASSSESGGLENFTLGHPFNRVVPDRTKKVTIEINGETVRPNIKSSLKGVVLSYNAAEWEPGLAKINDDNKKIVISVNQNIMESDFTTLHNQKLSKFLDGHLKKVYLIKKSKLSNNEINQKISSDIFIKEIWNWALWLGLLLLISETLITKGIKAETNS